MRRTTIFLDDRLQRQLKQTARAEGRSVAAVVREALAQYVAAGRRAPETRLPSLTGAYESGVRDTAERHEEILAQLVGKRRGPGAG